MTSSARRLQIAVNYKIFRISLLIVMKLLVEPQVAAGGLSNRMLKKTVQQGRSERRPEAYPLGYVEDLSDARTMLAGFFSILL